MELKRVDDLIGDGNSRFAARSAILHNYDDGIFGLRRSARLRPDQSDEPRMIKFLDRIVVQIDSPVTVRIYCDGLIR